MLISYPFLLILGHREVCNFHVHQFCGHIGWTESHQWQFVWKNGPKMPCKVFLILVFYLLFFNNFGLKMSYFPLNTSESSTVIHIFLCNELVPLEYHFDEYKCIRMGSNGKNAFLDFLVFLQKTLSANISAPRRGREAIQYSKSSSGCSLCSQTSSSTWGSILRALEPQT